ncbi:MAG: hypothetical protein L3J41_16445 [Melioribacteraceae bacterium]|nr:hypothetical protein [Melioribacteraceae bacterium]
MKLRKILLNLTTLIFVTVQLLVLSSVELFANTNPTVTNVAFTISNTTVTVTYDVSDTEQNTFTVYMEVSDDGGTTWDFDYGTTTGDIGDNVTEETNKTITWQYGGAENTNFKIKILADDLVGDQIYYARKIYNTVTIGTQVWLKENLDVGTMINSTNGGSNNDGEQTDNSSLIEKYCYLNNPVNCETYGGLYQWDEAMQYSIIEGVQGICPSGWHIPTYTEWLALYAYVNNQATKLIYENAKIEYTTYTNETGFSALFAGYYHYYNGFNSLSYQANFWSSTENGNRSYKMYMNHNTSGVLFYQDPKSYGLSVRCLKN